jgi:hypothetical protein
MFSWYWAWSQITKCKLSWFRRYSKLGTLAFGYCVLVLLLVDCVVLPSWAYAVAQLSEALGYKPEGHRFDSWCCYLDSSFIFLPRPNYGLGVDSFSNTSEYQEYLLGVKASVRRAWQPCHHVPIVQKSWKRQPAGPRRFCTGIAVLPIWALREYHGEIFCLKNRNRFYSKQAFVYF